MPTLTQRVDAQDARLGRIETAIAGLAELVRAAVQPQATASPSRAKAGSAVVVSRTTTKSSRAKADKPKSEKRIREIIADAPVRPCAWSDPRCKDRTFLPKGTGSWAHLSCDRGRAVQAALTDGAITREDVLAGKILAEIDGDEVVISLAD